MRDITCWSTPVGPVAALWEGDSLLALTFGHRIPTLSRLSPVQSQLGRELKEYFLGKRRHFSGEWAPQGTPFQQKVWKALMRIPYGETRTYTQIAKSVGRPGAQRAVGNAIGDNPLPLLIPCHRVVRSDGTLGGFSGGVGIKPVLLALEGVARFSVEPAPVAHSLKLLSSASGNLSTAEPRRSKPLARSQSKARSSPLLPV